MVVAEDDLEFRFATGDDWDQIWSIMSSVISRGDTYTYPPDLDEPSARAAWMLDGTSRDATFVATRSGGIVATARLSANHPGLGDHVANAGWMVEPAVAGMGIGRRFAEFVIDEARQRAYLAMQFNAVVATNTHAIALWTSLGFTIVGTVPRAFRHADGGLVGLHIMHRDLTVDADVASPGR